MIGSTLIALFFASGEDDWSAKVVLSVCTGDANPWNYFLQAWVSVVGAFSMARQMSVEVMFSIE